jgi:APA family basic amino acid/polyamine antiporter
MKKSLGFWRTWSLVVGTMIGSGVFLLPSVLAPYGSYSLGGWIISALGTLFIALTLGSLASKIPKIGGPYAYTNAAFGKLPAFLIAWGYWISCWTGVAALAVACSGYISVFIPVVNNIPVAGAISSIFIVWIFTGINISGIRTAGIVQLTTTILKLLPLIIIAFAGFAFGNLGNIHATNPNNESTPMLLAGVAMLTMWAYTGVESATIPADDVINPSKTIPRALITGTLTATFIYILSTFGVMALIPQQQLAESSSPFADAAKTIFGGTGEYLIAVGALISIVGTLNSLILLSGQMPLAAGLDKLFPRGFIKLNQSGAPGFGLIFSSVLATILIMMNYSKGLVSAFTIMILLSTLTVLIPYAISAASEIILCRKDNNDIKKKKGKITIAVFAFIFSLFAIVGSGTEIILYGLILLTVGLPVYYLMIRKKN